MVRAIDNGAGERILFRETAGTTRGELLEFDAYLAPGAEGPPPHRHLRQGERFRVLGGEMRLLVGGDHRILAERDEAEVPANTPHTWGNAGGEELRVRVELRPALRFERFLRESFALMAGNAGVIDVEKLRPLLEEFADEYRLEDDAAA